MDNRTKFLKAYANLPLNERNQVIITIDNQPLTWNAAWIEIDNDTSKGKEIVEKLVRLGIIV